ncbi:MAG: tripartite tricarboxylate transporter substrate binding protein [Oxalobacteraceae bacterium]|nr:MAG: tripartite tricarboxylate transporter substrate binding protein [Oxalobacteraceae bacterium]
MNEILKAAAIATMALAAITAPVAQAQAWPDHPITLVVPFPPGGSTDQVARALAPRLGAKLKQSVLVENRAGAAGTIGAAWAKRAAPDGYTFLVTSLGPLVIAPHLLKAQMQYDPQKDFDPITVAVQSPNVLIVPATSPHKTVADVIAFEKANPGKMSFASSGSGTSDHLTAELFWQVTGTTGVHVPYKGGAQAQTDVMGGQVDASFQNINAVIGFIKAGKMRALGITSAKRSAVLPDVPTMNEAGVKNLEVTSWQAVVAPKGMPVSIRDKFQATVVEVLNEQTVTEPFVSLGFEMVANSPAQFTAFQQADYARWKKVIETGKISLD